MSEQFSTPQQALIERLRRAPQPELSSDMREMIRARVLDALDHPPMPVPRPTLFQPVVVIVVVLAAAALLVGILVALSRQTQPAITPTPPVTLTVIPATFTPAPTLTATATATASLTLTLIPTASPTAKVGLIIVEGPVDQIDGNTVIIYGTPVQIPPDDPILGGVSVGDVLHVEGTQTGTGQVIVATTVVIINGDVDVNPSSGEVWQDDGSCAHPPPDWAPANGWRRRCEGKDKDKGNNGKPNKK